jgi:hypothetical protein
LAEAPFLWSPYRPSAPLVIDMASPLCAVAQELFALAASDAAGEQEHGKRRIPACGRQRSAPRRRRLLVNSQTDPASTTLTVMQNRSK